MVKIVAASICVLLTAIAVAGASTVTQLLEKYGKSAVSQTKERVVHFPNDRSSGQLRIQDEGSVRQLNYWFHWTDTGEPAQTDRVITKVAPATAGGNGNVYQLSRP